MREVADMLTQTGGTTARLHRDVFGLRFKIWYVLVQMSPDTECFRFLEGSLISMPTCGTCSEAQLFFYIQKKTEKTVSYGNTKVLTFFSVMKVNNM